MRNRFLVFVGVLVLFVGGGAFGQGTAAKPEFEVATVKPAAPLDMQKMAAQIQAGQMPKIGPHVDGSRAEYNYMSLKDLIAIAYKVKAYQVSGPAWLANERFDIAAKMPEGAAKDDAPAMLQTLLLERFKLVAHRATEEHPVLGLVVGKGGPKLKEAVGAAVPLDADAPLKPGEMNVDTPDGPVRVMRNADGSSTVNMGVRGIVTQKMDMQNQMMHMESSRVSMSGLADMLTNVMQMGGGGGRQVVDMTGLKGEYQVALDISLASLISMVRAQGVNAPGAPAASGAAGGAGSGTGSGPSAPQVSDPEGNATVFQSVQALGLRLEGRKAPVEQVVVDGVEKVPAAN